MLNLNDLTLQIIQLLGNNFLVVNAFSQDEKIDPQGTIAVSLENVNNLHTQPYPSYEIIFSIKGQTLSSEDLDKNGIVNLYFYAMQKLRKIEKDDLNADGVFINEAGFQSDENANIFTIEFRILKSVYDQ